MPIIKRTTIENLREISKGDMVKAVLDNPWHRDCTSATCLSCAMNTHYGIVEHIGPWPGIGTGNCGDDGIWADWELNEECALQTRKLLKDKELRPKHVGGELQFIRFDRSTYFEVLSFYDRTELVLEDLK